MRFEELGALVAVAGAYPFVQGGDVPPLEPEGRPVGDFAQCRVQGFGADAEAGALDMAGGAGVVEVSAFAVVELFAGFVGGPRGGVGDFDVQPLAARLVGHVGGQVGDVVPLPFQRRFAVFCATTVDVVFEGDDFAGVGVKMGVAVAHRAVAEAVRVAFAVGEGGVVETVPCFDGFFVGGGILQWLPIVRAIAGRWRRRRWQSRRRPLRESGFRSI